MKEIQKEQQKKLLLWFKKHKRDLPWRKTKDPYAIWISEVMLQQTTSKAVIPYYKKFLATFPTVKKLSQASTKEIFSLWAGLGYYRRAENLLKAAQKINQQRNFPNNHKDLLLLPGFGPYTSRAVSSLSFKEPVGVVDGNVIRFLSRFHGQAFEWWKSVDKNKLQNLADLWVKNQDSSLINQALMEMGSLVCLPQKPLCKMCPLAKDCKAFKQNKQSSLPLKKIKKELELWHWKPELLSKKSLWAFTKNKDIPFLKNKWMFPGSIQKIKTKPKKYDFIHSIMHYQIFITIQKKTKLKKQTELKWLNKKEIQETNPSSLIKKILLF